jgi:hypothetical protein
MKLYIFLDILEDNLLVDTITNTAEQYKCY